jgi:hypothetical protein
VGRGVLGKEEFGLEKPTENSQLYKLYFAGDVFYYKRNYQYEKKKMLKVIYKSFPLRVKQILSSVHKKTYHIPSLWKGIKESSKVVSILDKSTSLKFSDSCEVLQNVCRKTEISYS